MYKSHVPHRLGVHRNAAISLFRALLTKTRELDAGEASRTALENVIRRKFRENRNLWARFRLAVAFNNGYKALDTLDSAAAGDTSAISRVQNFLHTVPPRLKEPIPPPPPRPAKPPKPEPTKAIQPRSSVFDRPFLSISGKRRVPHFVVASSGVAFLRYKKPQPEALSGYIRKYQRKQQRRHDKLHELQEQGTVIARAEDDWDAIVDAEFRGPHGDAVLPRPTDELSWRESTEEAGIKPLLASIKADTQKQMARGFRLLGVWQREMKLAEEEERVEREKADQAAAASGTAGLHARRRAGD